MKDPEQFRVTPMPPNWIKGDGCKYHAAAWAVWMGANTAKRLADEWGIGHRLALNILNYARIRGLVTIHSRPVVNGRRVSRYRVTAIKAWA